MPDYFKLNRLSDAALENQLNAAEDHGDEDLVEACWDEFNARAESDFNCPRDEPVDEQAAYLDRMDRQHGPHHA